jgi:hypothetical protein
LERYDKSKEDLPDPMTRMGKKSIRMIAALYPHCVYGKIILSNSCSRRRRNADITENAPYSPAVYWRWLFGCSILLPTSLLPVL